jgi:DNA N-6-adenine-methyltransferase (Dam)
MSLGSHQRVVGKSQTHITPQWIINRTGPYGLDPCAADPRPWDCAAVNWTKRDDGLSRFWPRELRVFLNPPFNRFEVGEWISRLAEHGDGIALLHARTEAGWFEPIWQNASGILFMADRIFFHRPDGTRHPANSGAPPVLVAFGEANVMRLAECGIAGVLVRKWTLQGWGPTPTQNGRHSGFEVDHRADRLNTEPEGEPDVVATV